MASNRKHQRRFITFKQFDRFNMIDVLHVALHTSVENSGQGVELGSTWQEQGTATPMDNRRRIDDCGDT